MFKYEFEEEQAFFTQEFQGDGVSKFYNQTLNMNLSQLTQAKKDELENLALGNIVAVAQKQDGTYWLLGDKSGSGLTADSVNPNSGQANADGDIIEIILSGGNRGLADEVEESVVTSLL